MRTTALLSGGGIAIAANLIIDVAKHFGYDLSTQQDEITGIVTAAVGLVGLIAGLISHLHTKGQQQATITSLVKDNTALANTAGVQPLTGVK